MAVGQEEGGLEAGEGLLARMPSPSNRRCPARDVRRWFSATATGGYQPPPRAAGFSHLRLPAPAGSSHVFRLAAGRGRPRR